MEKIIDLFGEVAQLNRENLDKLLVKKWKVLQKGCIFVTIRYNSQSGYKIATISGIPEKKEFYFE